MPTIYILKCKDNCYFIGKTIGSYFKEIDNHFKGTGCEWTKLHKPMRLEMLRHFCDETDDDFYTRVYVTKYGIDKVRGGSYSQPELTKQQLYELTNHQIDIYACCYQCYQKGHKKHICQFLRNSFDKNDITEDANDDNKTFDDTTGHEIDMKIKSRTSILNNFVSHITYPLKMLFCRIFSHKLNNMMSSRLGRSGSFHRLYQFDVKN